MKLTLTALAAFALLATLAARADDAPKPAPAKPTPAKPAPRPGPNPGASGLEVTIKSAKIDYVGLKKPLPGGGSEDQVSGQKLLAIALTITNKGKKEITYKSFAGTPDGKDDRASLLTTTKKFLPLVNFGDLEAADTIKQATLKEGDSVTDTLYFMEPPAGVVPDLLQLPAKNHGDAGYWRLPVKIEAEK